MRADETTILNLPRLMRAKGATNAALSAYSGVDPSIISRARQGGAVKKFNGEAIMEALERYKFQRDPRGAK